MRAAASTHGETDASEFRNCAASSEAQACPLSRVTDIFMHKQNRAMLVCVRRLTAHTLCILYSSHLLIISEGLAAVIDAVVVVVVTDATSGTTTADVCARMDQFFPSTAQATTRAAAAIALYTQQLTPCQVVSTCCHTVFWGSAGFCSAALHAVLRFEALLNSQASSALPRTPLNQISRLDKVQLLVIVYLELTRQDMAILGTCQICTANQFPTL